MKGKMLKGVLAVVLTASMIFSNHTLSQVFAEEVNLGEESVGDEVGVTTGKCGKNLTWTLEGDTLTISGTGKMKDYSIFTNPSPWYRSSLTTIKIQNGVTSIGDGAFAECTNLTDITIPKSVTSIGESAFMECSSLEKITIPKNLTSIGGWAFSYCEKLASITIPSGVKKIGGGAFVDCKKLTSITIPSGVKK